MIPLTRLDGQPFALNEDLIERVEPNADTTIFTVGGNVYTVAESTPEVLEAVRSEKAAILRSSASPAPRLRLRVLDDGSDGEHPGEPR